MSKITQSESIKMRLRREQLKTKYEFPRKEPSHPFAQHTFLSPTNRSEHLKWIDNERVTFWCWLFIRHANSDSLCVEAKDGDNSVILYTKMQINNDPISHSERQTTINRWFHILENMASFADAYRVMKNMQTEWAFISNKVKDMSWLPRSKTATQWAWERMCKEPYFNKRGVISFYLPLDMIERYHAIVASFDETFPEDYMNLKEVIKYRNYLIHRLHEAYKRTVPTVKKDSRVQISVKISPAAKGKLDRLARERNATQQMLIEQLILSGHLD